MRKYIFLLLFVNNFSTVFGQSGKDSLNRSLKEDLLTLSKKQRTGGIILVTTGTVMMSISLGLAISELNSLFEPGIDYSDNDHTIEVLAVTGVVALAGGIYVLVRARKNSRRAMSLGFMLQPYDAPVLAQLANGNFPALQLQIRF